MAWRRVLCACVAVVLCALPAASRAQSPGDASFDLREFPDGQGGTVNLTTECRSQCWGTCWCHGTMSAVESNLLLTGNWAFAGSPWSAGSELDLAEYYLDKFNGFNRKGEPGDESGGYPGQEPPWPGTNTDVPLAVRTRYNGGGMPVHKGGDYKVVAACLSNLGAVNETPRTHITSSSQSGRDQFGYALDGVDPDPEHPAGFAMYQEDYTFFMPRHVEWLTLSGSDAEKRTRIKEALVTGGAVATAVTWSSYSSSTGDLCYLGTQDVNHSVTIIGWDDSRQITRGGQTYTGAWLCHNSWGSRWGAFRDGSFWLSYADVHGAKHPTMGGVQFLDARKVEWADVYSHSLHGWQFDTAADPGITAAANRFVTAKDERLAAVGFYTVEDDVDYTLGIYGDDLGTSPVETVTGHADRPGFHMIDLNASLELEEGEVFYVAVELRHDGGVSPQAIDASNQMTAALGVPEDPPYDIYSSASPNESFYYDGGAWSDFHDYDCYGSLGIWDDGGELTYAEDRRWNFAINAYAGARRATRWLCPPGVTGLWSDGNAGTWSDGVPDESLDAVIDNAGTVHVTSAAGSAAARRLYIGDARDGGYQQVGATLTVPEKLVLGNQAGSAGTATIEGGTLVAEKVLIANHGLGVLTLAGGTLSAGRLEMGDGGGTFAFTDGTLEAESIGFDLTQDGGILAAARSIGALAIEGDYCLNAGQLHVELSGCDNSDANDMQHDALSVAGDVHFAGTLALEWVPGEAGLKFGGTYDLIAYGGVFSGGLTIDCGFEAYLADASAAFDLGDGNSAVRVVLYDLLDGDADLSGEVDRLDFLALRSGFGSTRAGWGDGDFDLDGTVDFRDYLLWKSHCGTSVPGGKIPEPGALALFCGTAALAGLKRRRSSAR